MTNNKRILGKNNWISNDDFTSGFNNNDLIIGGSGCGKTGGYVIPLLKHSQSNMIVTDTKSQLYKKLSFDLIKKGYDVSVIDFIEPSNSCGYNPLDYIRCKIVDGKEYYNNFDIVSLARILVPDSYDDEAFWNDSARTVIAFLIAFTLEAFEKEDHYMTSVVKLFRQLKKESGRKKISQWTLENPDTMAAKKFDLFIDVYNSDKTWSCIMQFVSEALEAFDLEEAKSIFGANNQKSFHFSELWTKKKIVFLNISDTNRFSDKLSSLFYAQAMQIITSHADTCENGRLEYPVRFILDDFASNVYIEDFDKLISVIRSRNISVSVILQSLTQLNSMYSKPQADTIITNCDHLLYLGGQDIETARYVGYRCNKTEDTILLMPMGKAYLIERGKLGMMVDRVEPYKSVDIEK